MRGVTRRKSLFGLILGRDETLTQEWSVMRNDKYNFAFALILGVSFLVTTPTDAFAQGQKHKNNGPALATVSINLLPDVRVQIRDFYSSRTASGAAALPPGIRRRLARGKALPPGIAKKVVPAGLRSRIQLPAGFEIVEVGLDVFLIEVATDIIHDVLMDVVT